MFMADTRAWHKGVKPEDADRLIFQVEYANCNFTHPVDEHEAPATSATVTAAASDFPEMFRRFRIKDRGGRNHKSC
jgi:hypothetical protein